MTIPSPDPETVRAMAAAVSAYRAAMLGLGSALLPAFREASRQIAAAVAVLPSPGPIPTRRHPRRPRPRPRAGTPRAATPTAPRRR